MRKDGCKTFSSEKRKERGEFYDELCDYVHLSELNQTDALGDFSFNLALRHPYYEQDRIKLENTFDYAKYLLLRSLERNLFSMGKPCRMIGKR